MTKLDVMVLESHPGAARLQVEALEAAGHRVHHCYDPDRPEFPCRGVTEPDGGCPLDRGIDVTLLVRRRVAPKPTHLEHGVSCAIRAGIPVVEDGPTVLDPFEPWIAERVRGDVAATCEAAADEGARPLRNAIAERIRVLLASAGIDPQTVRCSFERNGHRLSVILRGPAVGRGLEQALAVRVHDAVRAAGRTYGQVDVSYRAVGDAV